MPLAYNISGEVFVSAYDGETWAPLVTHLPPIWSVETAAIAA